MITSMNSEGKIAKLMNLSVKDWSIDISLQLSDQRAANLWMSVTGETVHHVTGLTLGGRSRLNFSFLIK
jgi:hypothetical protein